MGCGASAPSEPVIGSATTSMRVAVVPANGNGSKTSSSHAAGLVSTRIVVAPGNKSSDASNVLFISRRVHPESLLSADEYSRLKSSGNCNYCDPRVFLSHTEDTFRHYSVCVPGVSSEEHLDRHGLHRLCEDCIEYFQSAVKEELRKNNKFWSEGKIQAETESIRRKYLPGKNLEECKRLCSHYLASELKYTEQQITRERFFLLFPNAHKNLFTYTPQITLARELLVQNWNQYAEKETYKDALKSVRHKDKTHSHTQSSRTASKTGHNGETLTKSKKRKTAAKQMFDMDVKELDNEGE